MTAVYALLSLGNEPVTQRDNSHGHRTGRLVTVYPFVTQPSANRSRFAAKSWRSRDRRYMVAPMCNRPVMEITMRARFAFSCILGLLALTTVPVTASSQTTTPAPTLDFSGLIFGNYQYRTDTIASNALGGQSPNRFDLGRVYLNFRMPAGERGSIRVTTDLYQNTGGGGYYAGWALRFKYAYFQYEFTKSLFGVDGMGAVGRVGMVHNVMVDHVDSFWPRFLGQNALETHGFFASADVGVSSLVTMPKRRGEAYLTVLNGTGYTAAETDRFKDIAARYSWTPFANDSGFLRTFVITPWYLMGRAAGNFAAGGAGQVGPGRNGAITEGVQRDRRGLFAAVRDRRFTGGAEFSQRVEEIEGGANTVVSPRVVRDRTSDLMSAFAVVRPLELADAKKRSKLSLFGRFDTLDFDDTPVTKTTVAWGGVMWDLNSRATFTLDYQAMKTKTTVGATTTTVPTNTVFLHWVTSF